MFFVSLGADISNNDVECSESLIKNIEEKLKTIQNPEFAKLTNVTGDDVCITALTKEENLEKTNKEIINILRECAEDLGDLNGISKNKETAGEGVSYAQVKTNENYLPDAIIIHFDTYGGESFVYDAAKSCIQAAQGMDGVGEVSTIKDGENYIPGVGYTGSGTDDPVVIANVYDLEKVSIIASSMVGAVLGCKNTYLVEKGSKCNVLPGSVIFTVSLFLNGNLIDFSIPFENKTRILR